MIEKLLDVGMPDGLTDGQTDRQRETDTHGHTYRRDDRSTLPAGRILARWLRSPTFSSLRRLSRLILINYNNHNNGPDADGRYDIQHHMIHVHTSRLLDFDLLSFDIQLT